MPCDGIFILISPATLLKVPLRLYGNICHDCTTPTHLFLTLIGEKLWEHGNIEINQAQSNFITSRKNKRNFAKFSKNDGSPISEETGQIDGIDFWFNFKVFS